MSNELWLPESARRDRTTSGRPVGAPPEAVTAALRRGMAGPADDKSEKTTMAWSRRTAAAAQVFSGGTSMATARPRDPMFYWEQNNLPYRWDTEDGLKKIREYSRAVYLTHPIIGSAVDIYSTWPLQGLELRCLAAETRVVTREGTLAIQDLAGRSAQVIDANGRWVEAEFASYGVQRLHKLVIERNRRQQVIHATGNHRWLVESGQWGGADTPRRIEKDTTDLQPGDRLSSQYTVNRISRSTPSSIGVAHGIVFGDGSLKGRSKNEGYVRLWEQKNIDLLRFFPEPNVTKYLDDDPPSVVVYDLPGYFKSLPSLEENASYLYGWLAGYFAADGTVSKKGECILYSATREHIDFAQTVCHILGINTGIPYEAVHASSKSGRTVVDESHTIWMLPLDGHSLTGEFFVMAHHRERWTQRMARVGETRRRIDQSWKVISIETTDRVEEVYCAQVPTTESFVLEGNLLTGNCKDNNLTDFYTELFLDQLNYREYLIDLGREYWVVGEGFSLGSFNDSLGVWEDDELINPDDVDVIVSPFLKDPRFEMKLPQSIRDVLKTRTPQWEYEALIRSYPELRYFIDDDKARMPVSSILLRRMMFKGHNFSVRGLPILMRAFRTLMQEEMLNAAFDSVASRLYTPLILAQLGASATELGTNQPWIPDDGDIADFESRLDSALAADFRIMISHFGVKMQNVFGREMLPRAEQDFERIDNRLLQVFGMSSSMLSGANKGETYAADALNFELVSQLLSRFQRLIKEHYRQRALVVAEAQGHYDYEVRGGKRYPVMEEILEVGEDGEQRIIERPKLLVPDMNMRCVEYGTQVMTPAGPVAAEAMQVGDPVLAWDETAGVLVESTVIESMENGIEPIYRVRTKYGRTIGVTEEHPFWTSTGWVKALHLEVGDRVRVATDHLPQSTGSLSRDDAYFLGLMVGDGGCTGNDVRFSTADPVLVDWVRSYAAGRGCLLTKTSDTGVDYRIARAIVDVPRGHGWKNTNPVKDLLKSVGLWGHTALTKRIPAAVWGAGSECWWAFLAGYLDTDGGVSRSAAGVFSPYWTSSNRGLLEDTQTMLALLGVQTRLEMTARRATKLVPKVSPHPAGRLIVSSLHDMAVLTAHLHPLLERKRSFHSNCAPQKARYNDPAWDEVVSIEIEDPAPTWSLGIDRYHTHITAGLVTHNTMNMQSEKDQRMFVEALRTSGVPVSMRTRLTNVPIDLDEERDLVSEEQVANAVAAQETRRRTYEQLKAQRLPIPEDLVADFEPKVQVGAPTVTTPQVQVAPPSLGLSEPADTEALVPLDDLAQADTPGEDGAPPTKTLPQNRWMESGNAARPAQSDERREGMPTAASLHKSGKVLTPMARITIDPAAQADDGSIRPEAGALQLGPAHIGRRASLKADVPLDEQLVELGWGG